MRVRTSLVITAFAAGVAGSPSVRAQETVPETPPELRDFRLDKPPALPQPEVQSPPKPDPVVAAPPSAVRNQAEIRPAVPTRSTQSRMGPARRNAAPVDRTQADQIVIEPEATSKEVLPPPEAKSVPTQAAPIVAEPAGDGQPISFWQIAAALAAFGLLTAIAILLWRRRSSTSENVSELSEIEPVKAVDPTPEIVTAPVAAAQAVAQATSAPTITVQFVPEKATITFAMLTIKGQLQLNNEGKADVEDMQLRAGLISASHQQQKATSQFFSTARDITPSPMGNAKAGEKIGIELELSVRLSEMHSFRLGDQRLLVPIMLATIEYRTGNETVPHRVEVACMIGRESTPPKAKMGPLRLDLGPRSFAPLGTRPLYA